MPDSPSRDLAGAINALIDDFIADSPENHLYDGSGEKAFAAPLVGFAAGADPLFAAFKEHVGPFHWTPAEIFNLTFPEATAEPAELTVASWVLPQTPVTRADNRRRKAYPAERWVRARTFGELVNETLRRHVVAFLAGAGISAVAPVLSPLWRRCDSPRFVFASHWSERHAAHACGLGTFGLCDGLITARGKAVRVGSVVMRAALAATPRPYDNHRAYCLYYAKGACGRCIDRCPAGALSAQGHDKIRCAAYMRDTVFPYITSRYGFEGKGCGLCQTGVPCESKIPLSQPG